MCIIVYINNCNLINISSVNILIACIAIHAEKLALACILHSLGKNMNCRIYMGMCILVYFNNYQLFYT